MNDCVFGVCPICKCNLEPSYEIEVDRENNRWKKIVDYLFCPSCGETSCVDDSFDGPWKYNNPF